MKLFSESAVRLSKMLRSGMCSAAEISASVLERIDARENDIGAYLTICDDVMQQAEAVDCAIAAGKPLHPLAGIPIAVKDNISTKDIRTTCASRMLKDYIPPYDAAVVERLRRAGAIIIGKTNMDEFAMGASGETSYFKKTHNPHNLTRVPGGSSGGSAAAVASGEAVLALGSDTGGSVRQPAAFCGVVGLKPTYGSVSRYGLIAFASSLEQIGCIGRSCVDTALLYGAICGGDKRDMTTVHHDVPDFSEEISGNVRGLRIGLPQEYFGDEIDPQVKKAVLHAAELFEKNGAILTECTLPGTKHAISAYYIISSAEASSNLARYDGVRYGYRANGCESLTEMYEKTRSEGFGKEVKRRILLGTFVLSAGYHADFYDRAKRMQQTIRGEFRDVFHRCDVLLTPTYPTVAPAFGTQEKDLVQAYCSDLCTVPVNLAGLPALSVPCGKSADGLPIGMQLIGRHFSERELFRVGHAYEQFSGGGNV